MRLMLDDFGTGCSSLNHVKRFPIEAINVDRAFCSGIVEDEGDRHILRAIVSMASAMDVAVVAEGVESVEQARRLRHLGIALVQGYAFGRPARPPTRSASPLRRCDAGPTPAAIHVVRTSGGHRRFPASELRRLAAEAATTTKPEVRNTALEATRRLVTQADLAGATLLERHGFLERFGDAAVRTLQERGAIRPELIGARRLFSRLRQVALEAVDERSAA